MNLLKKIVFGLIIFFLIFSLIPNLLNFQKKMSFYEKIKEDFEKAKKRQIELKTEIIKKKSFDEIEKTIRNQLNYGKKNELILIIPPLSFTPTPTPTPPLTNWEKWWKVFF